MNKKKFFFTYFNNIADLIKTFDHKSLINSVKLIQKCKKNNGKIILIGNGGSAAIASHISTDLSKNAGYRSINFNDTSLITCLSNDYGHEYWMKKGLSIYCDNKDLVILISSSGTSLNVLNAAMWCKEKKIKLITLTGNKYSNNLKNINHDGINFWVNSKAYNYIESLHLIILMSIVDCLIGKSIYKP